VSLQYVLITPAHNEAAFIEQTIRSVVAQTHRPLKWVIVNDGSTDDTAAIVSRYAAAHDWIELVSTPRREQRHFAGKVFAFDAGYARVARLSYDAIANLDADISLQPDHFEFLLRKLAADPSLGLVGTPFRDTTMYDYRFVSQDHVSGACQLFRRQCFEDIGGYQPSHRGGIDHIAVLTARMKGWRTRTFVERICEHHRPIGTATHGTLAKKFRVGVLDYALGAHPLWELSRTVYQMTRKPYVVGGLLILTGYVMAGIRRIDRPVSKELVKFRRREQMRRLRNFLTKRPLATS
jgi:biofilm PGA synthesis N-glycosyltransferase PgaC